MSDPVVHFVPTKREVANNYPISIVAFIFGMIERRLVILGWARTTRSCVTDLYHLPVFCKRFLSSGSSARSGGLQSIASRDLGFWPLSRTEQSTLPCSGPRKQLAEHSLSVTIKKRRFGTGVVGELADNTMKSLCS